MQAVKLMYERSMEDEAHMIWAHSNQKRKKRKRKRNRKKKRKKKSEEGKNA
jgi:hypothetical protein